MTRLGVRFVPAAIEQLEAADSWWRANRDKAPNLLGEEFEQAIDLLRDEPRLGAAYENDQLPDARRFLLKRTRFHIYYVVRHETLVVVAVWSAISGYGPRLPTP